jgi:hypothetical protein
MNLTREEIKIERLSCAESLYYFIDVFCQIQDRKSGGAIPFHLWPGQRTVVASFLTAVYLVALKARQLGITWLTAAYVLWRAIFRFNELVVVISAKEDLAIEFLDRVKYMFDRLPDWLKPKVYKRTTTELSFGYETKDERGNIKIEGLNSTIKSIPSTPDAGQSKTISLLVMDESALNRYCKDIWGSAKPTLEHAGGQAIIISNPSKTMPGWAWTRDLYKGSMSKRNEFERIFLDWRCVPGRGDDFLDRQRAAGLDEDDISMQYPTTEAEAVSSLVGSYFGRTIAKFEGFDGTKGVLVKSDTDGKYHFFEDPKGIIEVWEQPLPRWENRYVIGSDVSEGLGETSSVAYVYDRLTNEYVARMRSSRIAADVWAQELISLAEYYGHAMLAPERNGAGITTVIHLQLNYDHLYYRRRPGKMKGDVVMEYGWNESEEAKQILADELKRHYREVFTRVPCALLIDESSTFMRHENGQLKHEDGKYDDCVIAAGICLQASMMLPPPVDKSPKRRGSTHDARIEQLYKGNADSYEAMAVKEHLAAIEELGATNEEYGAESEYEDRGSLVSTMGD